MGRKSILTEEQAREVIEAELFRKNLRSRQDYAERFGVTKGVIDACALGKVKRWYKLYQEIMQP